MKGTVINFDKNKGYGFIKGNDQLSYFVHHTNILMSGYRYLTENQKVEFKPLQSAKGLEATEVQILRGE